MEGWRAETGWLGGEGRVDGWKKRKRVDGGWMGGRWLGGWVGGKEGGGLKGMRG